jgi:hypothetical protein
MNKTIEIIMLSEVTQVQKDKGHVLSLMWKTDTKNKCIYKSCLYLCIHLYREREKGWDMFAIVGL